MGVSVEILIIEIDKPTSPIMKHDKDKVSDNPSKLASALKTHQFTQDVVHAIESELVHCSVVS